MSSRWAECGDPRDTVYGMRELEVLNPDGNTLCVAADTRSQGKI